MLIALEIKVQNGLDCDLIVELAENSSLLRGELSRDVLSVEYLIQCFLVDPFADASKGADDDVQDGLVHIRIQQRNGRKTLTTVQGLSSEYDLKKIVRACKKRKTVASQERRSYVMIDIQKEKRICLQ
ncbi:unnamed protein product [Brassicogethes aeneus]|uniref:SUI1 domain-containing protein n=1 Tax=Brassicogethes aeneus TaxID=1431903 RepID=A0A9P0FA12_BRAAE|nr:unnamed protein product [Brassicogethes aeneus]